jgi:hypothetical protein
MIIGFLATIVLDAILVLAPPSAAAVDARQRDPVGDRRQVWILRGSPCSPRSATRSCRSPSAGGAARDRREPDLRVRSALFDACAAPTARSSRKRALISRMNNDVIGAERRIVPARRCRLERSRSLTLVAMIAPEWRLTFIALLVLRRSSWSRPSGSAASSGHHASR